MLHACTLIRTISLSYCGILLSFCAISLSYTLFHFPSAVSIEQLFSPYILNGQYAVLLNLEIVNMLPTENVMKGNNEAHSIT